MKVKATRGFAGVISMASGEVRDVPEGVAAPLLKCGYLEFLELPAEPEQEQTSQQETEETHNQEPEQEQTSQQETEETHNQEPEQEQKPEQPKRSRSKNKTED